MFVYVLELEICEAVDVLNDLNYRKEGLVSSLMD